MTKVLPSDIGELTQSELELIHLIRTRFRYGEVVIETRDGKPYRIRKAVEYEVLG